MRRNRLDFLVIGTQKGGTTALDKYLRTHPKVQMARRKEVHFFDNDENFDFFNQYWKLHRHFDFSVENKVRGECTPIYMYWPESIKRIYEYRKDMKLISVLRDPTERAYSHWNMECDRGVEKADFSTAIRQECNRCKSALPELHRVYSYVDRGFYCEQLRRLWRYFPKENILVLKQEDLKKCPEKTLGKLTEFLNIPPFENIIPESVHSRKYSCQLKDEDRDFLHKIYNYEILQLQDMLDWDCSDWLN